MLEVIFITFQIRNLIHKGMTPSRLPQYVCVFSTNWETVCIYEDWAAVLLVLAHSCVGYVSLHDSITLGGCIHCFSGSIRIKYYAPSYLKMHSTFFYVINFFFYLYVRNTYHTVLHLLNGLQVLFLPFQLHFYWDKGIFSVKIALPSYLLNTCTDFPWHDCKCLFSVSSLHSV